jgi:hypothetical protein
MVQTAARHRLQALPSMLPGAADRRERGRFEHGLHAR